MERQRFAGKRVFVTGAAGRIGAATARAFAAEGAQVVVGDLPSAALDALAQELGGTALAYDAAVPAEVAGVIPRVVDMLGGLDVLCNIAGIYVKSHTLAVGDADWARMLQINLSSAFTLSRDAVAAMGDDGGSICSTASLAALEGLAYATAYAVSKAGIVAMTKSMASEFASRGIRVNCICPGGVRSPMSNVPPPAGFDPELALRRSRLKGLVDGYGEPEDIAAAFLFMSSPEARYVSGTALLVDGGQNLL